MKNEIKIDIYNSVTNILSIIFLIFQYILDQPDTY